MSMKRAVIAGLILAPLFLSGCILDTVIGDFVNKEPRAVISATPMEGAAPLTVQLDGRHSHDDDGAIIEYRWAHGDPMVTGSELGSVIQHTYEHPGTYLVKLTVTDDEGAMHSKQLAVVVTNSKPFALASASRDEPYPGQEITLDGSGSYDLNGTIVEYAWDFGDGGAATGSTVTHKYAEGGYYVVRLTVTDDEGATASANCPVNVLPGTSNCTEPPASSGTCGTSVNVLAVISGVPTSCGVPAIAGDPLTLDGTYSRSEGGSIVGYEWNFGDGTTATGPIVTHTYTKAWAYAVTLTVTDEGGNSDSCTVACSVGAGTCY